MSARRAQRAGRAPLDGRRLSPRSVGDHEMPERLYRCAVSDWVARREKPPADASVFYDWRVITAHARRSAARRQWADERGIRLRDLPRAPAGPIVEFVATATDQPTS